MSIKSKVQKLFKRMNSIVYSTPNETERRNLEFRQKLEKEKALFESALIKYNSLLCQCAYPRYQQIAGIDCSKSGDSFRCFDTELLIDMSRPYFDIEESELKDENQNQKWICKKCASTYEYGWQDFSIAVDRQKLRLVNLNIEQVGKPVIKPIPLYLGLMGHSYPPKSEMISVSFEEFENYITEV